MCTDRVVIIQKSDPKWVRAMRKQQLGSEGMREETMPLDPPTQSALDINLVKRGDGKPSKSSICKKKRKEAQGRQKASSRLCPSLILREHPVELPAGPEGSMCHVCSGEWL